MWKFPKNAAVTDVSYVIVPPEYRALGCLPADQSIPALMKHLNLPYYAGLLSAAQYHGAAHQRPQAFQVFLSKNRRPIECGMVRVVFIALLASQGSARSELHTPRGTVLMSSPEGDGAGPCRLRGPCGGTSQVGTVLSELAERIDPEKLADGFGDVAGDFGESSRFRFRSSGKSPESPATSRKPPARYVPKAAVPSDGRTRFLTPDC